MSDFKAKMHQITALPQSPSCDALLIREKGEGDGRGSERRGKKAFPHLFNPTLTIAAII